MATFYIAAESSAMILNGRHESVKSLPVASKLAQVVIIERFRANRS